MLKITNLRFSYNAKFRLEIDDLAIREGEVLGIIGTNGAGKTTLLNIIAMFEKQEAGSVEVFGQSLPKNNKEKIMLRRQMAYVFSHPYLLNDTVYNNARTPLELRGIRDVARLNQLLEFFKISRLKNNDANTLSEGEKHRAALVRALVSRPKLLLLDEPFLSLDESFKESLIADLRKIIKVNQITTLFVTQEQSEVLALADTIAVMKEGRILQTGKPEEIFNKPVSKEVADFVGVRTIVEGKIIDKTDNLCFIKVNANIIEAVSAFEKGDAVFVCIRPENVVLSNLKETSSARNNLRAVITNIGQFRLEYKVSLDCGFPLNAFISRQSVKAMDLEVDRQVFVSFKATAVHLIRK